MRKMLHRRLRVFETNWGRDAGWSVEWQGRCVALLLDPRYADMFWDRYTVQWVTTDAAERKALESQEDCLWWGERLVYRNLELGEVVTTAFAAGPPLDNEIVVRGLYVQQGEPWPWEALLLWWRRKRVNRCPRSGAAVR